MKPNNIRRNGLTRKLTYAKALTNKCVLQGKSAACGCVLIWAKFIVVYAPRYLFDRKLSLLNTYCPPPA